MALPVLGKCSITEQRPSLLIRDGSEIGSQQGIHTTACKGRKHQEGKVERKQGPKDSEKSC